MLILCPLCHIYFQYYPILRCKWVLLCLVRDLGIMGTSLASLMKNRIYPFLSSPVRGSFLILLFVVTKFTLRDAFLSLHLCFRFSLHSGFVSTSVRSYHKCFRYPCSWWWNVIYHFPKYFCMCFIPCIRTLIHYNLCQYHYRVFDYKGVFSSFMICSWVLFKFSMHVVMMLVSFSFTLYLWLPSPTSSLSPSFLLSSYYIWFIIVLSTPWSTSVLSEGFSFMISCVLSWKVTDFILSEYKFSIRNIIMANFILPWTLRFPSVSHNFLLIHWTVRRIQACFPYLLSFIHEFNSNTQLLSLLVQWVYLLLVLIWSFRRVSPGVFVVSPFKFKYVHLFILRYKILGYFVTCKIYEFPGSVS